MKHPVKSAFFAALVALCVVGCESEDDSGSAVSISPSSCKLQPNQSRVFTASGGRGYHWSVQDPSLGSISSSTGSSVTYTAKSGEGHQILTVTAKDISEEDELVATATIQQFASTEATELEISSDTSTVNAGATVSSVALSATGGDGANYKWSLSNPSIGSLTKTTGNAVAYTPKANTAGKVQQVTVSSAGKSKSCTISHTTDATHPAISGGGNVRADATVSSVALSATGGDGANYKWSLSNTSIGTLTRTTGNAVAYTPKANTVGRIQHVTVSSAGMSSSVTISHVSGVSDVAISGDMTVQAGATVTTAALNATGGDGENYKWSLSDASIGKLTKTTGNAVGYMPVANTTGKAQQITVTSGGRSTSRVIKHQ